MTTLERSQRTPGTVGMVAPRNDGPSECRTGTDRADRHGSASVALWIAGYGGGGVRHSALKPKERVSMRWDDAMSILTGDARKTCVVFYSCALRTLQ